uniref:Mat-r n=1 Tax=Arundo donax TaxID=35708 RepID=A0A0A9BX51_ARUDO
MLFGNSARVLPPS